MPAIFMLCSTVLQSQVCQRHSHEAHSSAVSVLSRRNWSAMHQQIHSKHSVPLFMWVTTALFTLAVLDVG